MQEPAQKGKQGFRSAPDFRAKVAAEVRAHRDWPNLEDRIGVSLRFVTTKKQPPNLEKMVKHYIDQLSHTHDDGELGHLYADDAQIQLLHASWFSEPDMADPDSSGEILVEAIEAAGAASAMREAAERTVGSSEEEDDDLNWFDELREELADSERLAQSDVPELQESAALMRAHTLRRCQERILKSNDRWVQTLIFPVAESLLGAKPSVNGLGPDVGSGLTLRSLLFQSPGSSTSLGLPPLPIAQGEGEAFRAELRKALEDYVQSHLELFPLLVPARVTIFVVQPPLPKDLDNIMLDVMPAVTEVLQPQREPWRYAPLYPSEARPDISDSVGVWSYEVVELARLPEDPEAGMLSLVLGYGLNFAALWEAAVDRNREGAGPEEE